MSALLNTGRSDQQNLTVIKVRFRPQADIKWADGAHKKARYKTGLSISW
jgi:hypothetical protein